ncbi:MAG: hypothetical protein PWQ17_2499 [Anaerophaga sp.]|nr:hypothetical protein [Anaerophaga sp.]MDN5290457.1 hypothetical protein [Anaerophaga sp.]
MTDSAICHSEEVRRRISSITNEAEVKVKVKDESAPQMAQIYTDYFNNQLSNEIEDEDKVENEVDTPILNPEPKTHNPGAHPLTPYRGNGQPAKPETRNSEHENPGTQTLSRTPPTP